MSINRHGSIYLNSPSSQIGRVLDLVVKKTGGSVLGVTLTQKGKLGRAIRIIQGDTELLRLLWSIDSGNVNPSECNPTTMHFLIGGFRSRLTSLLNDPCPPPSKILIYKAQNLLNNLKSLGQSIIELHDRGQLDDLNDFFALCSSFFEAFERYHNFKDKAELDSDYKGDIPLVVDLERTVEIDQYHIDVIECIINYPPAELGGYARSY